MNADLSIDELGWLLGLASARRRKREQSLEQVRRKAGQTTAEFEHGRTQIERSLAWARSVEDHLILLIGPVDQTRLRLHQRERYEQLKRTRIFPVTPTTITPPNPELLDRSNEVRSTG